MRPCLWVTLIRVDQERQCKQDAHQEIPLWAWRKFKFAYKEFDCGWPSYVWTAELNDEEFQRLFEEGDGPWHDWQYQGEQGGIADGKWGYIPDVRWERGSDERVTLCASPIPVEYVLDPRLSDDFTREAWEALVKEIDSKYGEGRLSDQERSDLAARW